MVASLTSHHWHCYFCDCRRLLLDAVVVVVAHYYCHHLESSLIRPVVADVVVAVEGGGGEGDTTVLLVAGEGYASTMTVRLHLPAADAAAASGRGVEYVVVPQSHMMPFPEFAAAGEDYLYTDIAGTVVVAGVPLERKYGKMEEEAEGAGSGNNTHWQQRQRQPVPT